MCILLSLSQSYPHCTGSSLDVHSEIWSWTKTSLRTTDLDYILVYLSELLWAADKISGRLMVAGRDTKVRRKTMDKTKTMSSVIHHKISKISKVSLNSLVNHFSSAAQPEAAHILRKHAGTLPLLWPRGHNITGVSQTTKRNCSFLLSACVHLSQANCLLCFHILFLSLLMSAFWHLCLTFLVLLLPQSFYSERKLVTCGMWGMQCLGIWSLAVWVQIGWMWDWIWGR